MDDANEGGALGSNIWALRGRLDSVEVLVLFPAALPLVTAVGVVAEGGIVVVTGFKSVPVNMLEAKETLGGKLGGMGVESVMVESLLECCCLLVSKFNAGLVTSLNNDTGMMG